MSAAPPTPRVLETVRTRTLLGVAFNDLLTDSRVVDGLKVDAWPVDGGRVTRAFQTRSGAYAFRGLDRMRRAEHPLPGDPDVAPRDFVVQAVDPKGRFLDTVLTVTVPTDGLVTQGDVLDTPSDGSLDDLPIYLFPAPQRALPTHVAAVRAQVVDHDREVPVPWCRVDVVVEPDGAARRASGVADAQGNVLVVVPYPRFGPPAGAGDDGPGEPGELPDEGTRGTPVVDRTWPVVVTVRHEPDLLDVHPGARAPALDRVLAQGATDLWATTDGPPGPSSSAELQLGVDLILRTEGDPGSRLLIEGTSS